MATQADAWPENVDGPFCVDDQCIDCDACRGIAPAFFRRNDAMGYSYVFRQPETPEEREACHEAMDRCPCGAIREQ
jgi:ferredoxin